MNTNTLMMLMLMAPSMLSSIFPTGGTTNMQSILPLMLLSGGRIGANGMMLTLMTGNPLFMLMQPQRRYRRRYNRRRVIYVRSRY